MNLIGQLKKQIIQGIIIVILFTCNSCDPITHLSKNFAKRTDSTVFLFLQPEYLFLTNKKKWEIEHFDSLTPSQKDSALLVNSRFIQYINSEKLLKLYSQAFINELQYYGFQVYTTQNLDSFFTARPYAYIINVVQIELEEFVQKIRKEEEIGKETYYKDLWRNAVSVNCWIELKKINGKKSENKLFFASHLAGDYIEGQFRQNQLSGEVKYTYTLRELLPDGIGNLFTLAGKKQAGYLFDYLLNVYLKKTYSGYDSQNTYYHYNWENRMLEAAGSERFTLMKSP